MRFKRRSPCLILAALALLVLPAAALAQVAVSVEGAYTATNLDVYIYANIATDPLCSYGVTLTYNVTKVTVATATKNDAIWYFGTPAAKQPYVDPDTAIPGQILFIGGKLDTGSPAAGVIGTRVLLGKATFNRVAGADTAFGIGVALGKTTPHYDNIVTTGGAVQDGFIGWGPVRIFGRGDANADGAINVNDITFLRRNIGAANLPPWADCNGDGVVNVNDITWLRRNISN